MKRFFITIVFVGISLLIMASCEESGVKDDQKRYDDITYENEWTYMHNRVGALKSDIYSAFIDTREVNIWCIYLAPVRNISFEEVMLFSPVKITVSVDFPLDGTIVRFSDDSLISVEYIKEQWNGHNAHSGVIKAEYDARINCFRIYFDIPDKLTGSYEGAIEIIE